MEVNICTYKNSCWLLWSAGFDEISADCWCKFWRSTNLTDVELWRNFRSCTRRSTTFAVALHNTLLTADAYVLYMYISAGSLLHVCATLAADFADVVFITFATHTCAFIYLFQLGALFSAELSTLAIYGIYVCMVVPVSRFRFYMQMSVYICIYVKFACVVDVASTAWIAFVFQADAPPTTSFATSCCYSALIYKDNRIISNKLFNGNTGDKS